MKGENRIQVNKEKREEMIASIRSYFLKEREDEMGQLAASMMLDFISEKLGPEYYNQGIADAYKYMNDKVEDMQSLLL